MRVQLKDCKVMEGDLGKIALKRDPKRGREEDRYIVVFDDGGSGLYEPKDLIFLDDVVTFEVSLPPWSESEKSYNLLIEKGESAGSWSRGEWFPKKASVLCWGASTLTVPRWLFDKLQIEEVVTLKPI